LLHQRDLSYSEGSTGDRVSIVEESNKRCKLWFNDRLSPQRYSPAQFVAVEIGTRGTPETAAHFARSEFTVEVNDSPQEQR
jgi:hypothetical protein